VAGITTASTRSAHKPWDSKSRLFAKFSLVGRASCPPNSWDRQDACPTVGVTNWGALPRPGKHAR
jgi:hypothetical protein